MNKEKVIKEINEIVERISNLFEEEKYPAGISLCEEVPAICITYGDDVSFRPKLLGFIEEYIEMKLKEMNIKYKKVDDCMPWGLETRFEFSL